MFPVDETQLRLDIPAGICYIHGGSAEDQGNGAWFFVSRHEQSYTLTSKVPCLTAGCVSWEHAHGPQQTPLSSMDFCFTRTRSVRAMTHNTTAAPFVSPLAVSHA